MTGDKATQRAGDNSSQTLVLNQFNEVGVSEERAKEIAHAQAKEIVREAFAREAAIVAHGRITRADQKIIAKLAAEELLDIFGEPAFLSAYQRAQIGAANTDSEESYDILANLLAERARADISPVKSATLKAIECIDLVDDAALVGLTALWAITTLTPMTFDPAHGIDVIDEMMSLFGGADLPSGHSWIDHLESLNLVREDTVSRYNPYQDFLVKNCPSWVCVGYTDDEMSAVVEEIHQLTRIRFMPSAIVPHYYKPGYVKFDARANRFVFEHLNRLSIDLGRAIDSETESRLTELLAKMDEEDGDCKERLFVDLNKRDAIRVSLEWFDALPNAVRVTHPGKALAYTNAKRFHGLDGVRPLSVLLREG